MNNPRFNNPQQPFNPVQFMMNVLQSGQNPNVILQNLQQKAQNNPQLQSAFNELKVLSNQMQKSGMTPQQFITQYAKQRGVDMTPFINSLNSNRGIQL